MNPIGAVFFIQLILAFAGVRYFRREMTFLHADETIDHPSSRSRMFYRFFLFCFCNMISLIASVFAFVPFLPTQEIKESSELVRAAFLLVLPIPLATVFYIILVKWIRYSGRRIQSTR